jgi:apolipoprotein D and lipocalin family protein
VAFAAVGAFVAISKATGRAPSIPVVPSVDFNRYAGAWYEIARLPNRFEKDCDRDVTAVYEQLSDGSISVTNSCTTAEGRRKLSMGKARVADPRGPNTKLKVTFFWPFRGDYWILELDPGYRWVMVGEPQRRYLWFLSRTPHMDDETYRMLLKSAAGMGFDVDRLMRTKQTPQ